MENPTIDNVTPEDFMGYWIEDGQEVDNYNYPILPDIKSSPLEYYNQFNPVPNVKYNINFIRDNIDKLEKELSELGIYLFYFKWDRRSLYSDHSSILLYYCDKEYEKQKDNYPNGCIFFSEINLYRASLDYEYENEDDELDINESNNILRLHHLYINFKNTNLIQSINSVLQNIFPNRTNGLTCSQDSIIIFMKEHQLKDFKSHHSMYIGFIYNDKKKIKSKNNYTYDDNTLVVNQVREYFGKDIIYRFSDYYNYGDKIHIYFEVYDDKKDEFIRLAQNINDISIPEPDKITANDD